MAIEKDISIHGSNGIEKCIDYIKDSEKTDIHGADLTDGSSDINKLLDYASNLEKTVFTLDGDKDILVTGILCDDTCAARDFAETKLRYDDAVPSGRRRGSGGTKTVYDKRTGEQRTVAKESIEAYHVIQSFPALAGLDPRLVHKIGLEYAKAAFPDHQCVVSTHMNTDNLHNHIVVCAYQMGKPKKLAMNKTFRRQIRQINDEISIKYNLPIIIGNETGQNISMSRGEYYARANGQSFKEQVRSAITSSLSKEYVSSWSDFIVQMNSYGYSVKETKKNITYIKTDKDKSGKDVIHRIRESRLGSEFEKQSICRDKNWKVSSPTHLSYWELERQNDLKSISSENDLIDYKKDNEKLRIHISRYDDNGIRRADLEMLFLAAIKIIMFLWNRLTEKHKGRTIIPDKEHEPRLMIKELSDCMKLAKLLNVSSIEDIDIRKNETGKNISVIKKELSSIKTISDAYKKLAEKVTDYRSIVYELALKGVNMDNFYLTAADKRDAAKAMAKIIPMTPSQRRDLFLCSNKAENTWRLDRKYEDISYIEADKILDYLNGRSETKPDVLISVDDFNIKRERLRKEAALGDPEKRNARMSQDKMDEAFDKSLQDYPPDIQLLLTRCRNILKDLTDLGYGPESLDKLLNEAGSYQRTCNSLKDELSKLNSEYKNLCRLEDGIKLAREHCPLENNIMNLQNENSASVTVSFEPYEIPDIHH